jgi:hypothetical protein
MDAFLAALDAIPHGRVLVVATLVVLTLQVFALGNAWRTRGARRALESQGWRPDRFLIIAGLSILALPAIAGLIVHEARATMLQSATAIIDPAERAQAFSRSIAAQLNTIGLSVGRWQLGRSPRRLSLIGLGLYATALGTSQWALLLVHAFAGLAGAPPEQKAQLLDVALDDAHHLLETFSHAAVVTVVGLTTLAAVLTALDRRSAAPSDSSLSTRGTLLASIGALCLAAVLFRVARPMSLENQLPWPLPPAKGEVLLTTAPPTPDLDGPDLIERAPVIQVFPDVLALDGTEVDLATLGDKLRTLRNNFRLLQPNAAFTGCAIVVIDAHAAPRRVTAVFQALHEVAYTNPRSLRRPARSRRERSSRRFWLRRAGGVVCCSSCGDSASWSPLAPCTFGSSADSAFPSFTRRRSTGRQAGPRGPRSCCSPSFRASSRSSRSVAT